MYTKELPQAVKDALGKVLGTAISYPSDCERLALDIRHRINETIGITTLKRLFGFAGDVTSPRTSTLDILAKYAGYPSYLDMTRDLCPEGDSDFDAAPDIDVSDLKGGEVVTFRYLPEREVKLEYSGDDLFRVMSSEGGGSLRVGDIVSVSRFSLGHPLIIDHVIREGKDLGRYVAGKVSGIIYLFLDPR